jgi:hypothetical protein
MTASQSKPSLLTSAEPSHSFPSETSPEAMTYRRPRKDRRRRAAATIKRHRVAPCPLTGKRRYRDAKQAKEALRSARETRQQDEQDGRESRRGEVRAYVCPSCLGLHLTHLRVWIERVVP